MWQNNLLIFLNFILFLGLLGRKGQIILEEEELSKPKLEEGNLVSKPKKTPTKNYKLSYRYLTLQQVREVLHFFVMNIEEQCVVMFTIPYVIVLTSKLKSWSPNWSKHLIAKAIIAVMLGVGIQKKSKISKRLAIFFSMAFVGFVDLMIYCYKYTETFTWLIEICLILIFFEGICYFFSMDSSSKVSWYDDDDLILVILKVFGLYTVYLYCYLLWIFIRHNINIDMKIGRGTAGSYFK